MFVVPGAVFGIPVLVGVLAAVDYVLLLFASVYGFSVIVRARNRRLLISGSTASLIVLRVVRSRCNCSYRAVREDKESNERHFGWRDWGSGGIDHFISSHGFNVQTVNWKYRPYGMLAAWSNGTFVGK